MTQFDGATVTKEDTPRLQAQLDRVYVALYQCNAPVTVSELQGVIAINAGKTDPEASIGARLRDLRKVKFGGHNVKSRYRKGVKLYEYWLEAPPPPTTTQATLFKEA